MYMNDAVYGQGLDSTVRIRGDEPFCDAIHGDVAGPDCHLDGWKGPSGNDPNARVNCEMQLLGSYVSKPLACPIWQFRTAADPTPRPCVDDQDAAMSCDHFGRAGGPLDDPKTPPFEGLPAQCGEQLDSHGPIAGPFTIAHGAGEVRACRPDGGACGPWKKVDH